MKRFRKILHPTAAQRFFLGSVAARVLALARCPVLT